VSRARSGKLIILALGAALTASFPCSAGAVEERAGTVVAVDQSLGTLVLLVGPWRMKDEDVVPGNVPLTLRITPSTRIQLVPTAASSSVDTDRPVPTQTSTPSGSTALQPGVFAIVSFTPTGGELVAEEIDVIAEPLTLYPAPPAAPSAVEVSPR